MNEYKVVIYQESLLGSLLFGASKTDPLKFTALLNQNASQGWRVVCSGQVNSDTILGCFQQALAATRY
jgi:hypothetical protein